MARRKIKVGDRVHWRDPASHEYPKKDRAELVKRVFIVQDICYDNEVATILEVGESVGMEQEVMPHELELIKQ